MTAKKKKKGGGIFWKLLFLVALCVFCFSMYQLVNIYLGYKKGVDEYHAVAEATTVQSSEPLEVVEEKKGIDSLTLSGQDSRVRPSGCFYVPNRAETIQYSNRHFQTGMVRDKQCLVFSRYMIFRAFLL